MLEIITIISLVLILILFVMARRSDNFHTCSSIHLYLNPLFSVPSFYLGFVLFCEGWVMAFVWILLIFLNMVILDNGFSNTFMSKKYYFKNRSIK